MFIYSFKARDLKAIAAIGSAFILLVVLILTVPTYGSVEASADGEVSRTGIRSAEDAKEFLSRLGYEVVPEAKEIADVKIPADFDRVFSEYNNIQKRQGCDLSSYRRRTVKRYTFAVTNYENYGGEVIADVIVYRGNVIGGDLCGTPSSDAEEPFVSELMK